MSACLARRANLGMVMRALTERPAEQDEHPQTPPARFSVRGWTLNQRFDFAMFPSGRAGNGRPRTLAPGFCGEAVVRSS